MNLLTKPVEIFHLIASRRNLTSSKERLWFIILLIGLSLISIEGCNRSEQIGNSWNPQTQRLDQFCSDGANFTDLEQDVKRFYASLEKKEWPSTYDQRWNTFKQDFPESLYLKIAGDEGKRWDLLNYEVLSVEAHILSAKVSNSNEVVLICKFIEQPGPTTNYATVRWRKEEGMWRCDAAGPAKLSIFGYTRW
jgi:hypothetical protein